MMLKLTGVKEQSMKIRRKYNHNTFKIHCNNIIVSFIISSFFEMGTFHMLNLVNLYIQIIYHNNKYTNFIL